LDHPREKKPNHALQVYRMMQLFPQFKCSGKSGSYIFEGLLKPKETSREYTIRIIHTPSNAPKTFVIQPELHNNPKHTYSSDGSLCLYKPSDFRWNNNLLIADYIVPWTCAWLYFYEQWLETRIWYGPEASHEGEK
jgi:hypothetical protein